MKFLAAVSLALALMIAPAFSQTKSTPVGNLLQNFQKVTLADLQYADALAQAHNNTIAHTCWAAWIDYMKAEQTALTGADGAPLPLPSVHLITDAQRAMDLVAILQPTSTISVACAALGNAVKLNVLNLITSAASGALLFNIPLP